MTSLGQVCTIQSGAGFPTKYQGKVEGEFPFFKVSDMNLEGNEDELVTANNYIDEKVRIVLGARGFPKGSVLFPKVGGAIATNKKRKTVRPSCADNNVMGLIPDASALDENYLFHWMKAQDLYEFSNKANPPSITQSTVRDWPISVPPLDEQKRIVAVLDQAFAALDRARAHAEANLADAHHLLKAKLDATFNHSRNECRLDELFQVGSSKRVLKSEWKDSGVPFYRGREITRLAMEGQVANELFISEAHYAELAARSGVPAAGDILVTAIGTIGNAHIVRGTDRFYFKDASVLWMRRTSKVSSEYVKFWIRSSSFHNQLDRGNGATVDTLTIGKLQGLLIPNPSAEEQTRAVQELATLEKASMHLKSVYGRKLTDLASLRQSLLQKAFSGQLT